MRPCRDTVLISVRPAPSHMDDQRMLEQIKEFFRSVLALQIETVRGDIRAAEAKIGAVDTKVEVYRRELLAEFRRLEEKVDVRLQAVEQILDARLDATDTRLGSMDTRLGSMETRFAGMDKRLDGMDQKLGLMDQKLDLFRKELVAEIRTAIHR